MKMKLLYQLNNMYDIMTKNISNHKKNFSWEEFERTLQLYD